MKKVWRALYHFFPVQLLLLHLRRSTLLLAFWAILFALSGGWIFKKIGFHYLFEMPEYLGKVSFISYLIMGVVLGFFVMAFHIASYIFYSYRFPFLATLSKPLYRFSINNSAIPFIFYVFYAVVVARALWHDGFTLMQISINIFAIFVGSILSIGIAYSYFFTALKNRKVTERDTGLPERFGLLIYKDKKLEENADETRVYTYLRNFKSIRLARKSAHYDVAERLQVLQQHHHHAGLYFVMLITLTILLGLFSDNRFFMLPAGASVVLLFTTYLMIFGALFSWLKTWTLSVLIVAFLVLNYFSAVPSWQRVHKAAGLSYVDEPLPYSYHALAKITTDSIVAVDKKNMLKALNGWKSRQATDQPKLVIFNSSGGGLRSSLFSMATWQYLDSLTNGEFSNQLFLITGSSGGMIGSAYYRELLLQRNNNARTNINTAAYYNILSADVLNDVGFTLAVNDLFIPFKKHKRGGFTYLYDRGVAWERRFNINTNYVLEKPYNAYAAEEAAGKIPLMILAPTILNNGQRLLISPMGLSFLSRYKSAIKTRVSDLYDGVEFNRFFKNRQGDSLSFVTALRMSSTFPYITPMVSMPTHPRMEVVDAGARDNDGFLLTLRFLHNFKDWIVENTSGVVVVQALADRPLINEIKDNPYKSRFQALVKPVGAMVQSFGSLQGYSRAEMLTYASDWANFKLDVVPLDLLQNEQEVSLSWHLTTAEKQFIYQTVRDKRLAPKIKKTVQLIKE